MHTTTTTTAAAVTAGLQTHKLFHVMFNVIILT